MTEPIPREAWLKACMIGVALTLASYAETPRFAGPHETHAAQLADLAPVPLPDEPTLAVGATEPTLRFEPETAPPGTPVKLIFTPPKSDVVTDNWGPLPFGLQQLNESSWYVWPLLGENTATVEVLWLEGVTIKRLVLTATHVCGDPPPPPPPKPLKELAGPDAPALAIIYRKLAAGTFTDHAAFLGVHNAALVDRGLADNGAREAIETRLAKLEPWTLGGLRAELLKIAGELGETPQPTPPVVVDPTRPVAATYVYEKDQTAIPPGVQAGLNRLNRERNVLATAFEEDTVDGDGDTPDQYRTALAAARQHGLPALVITTGETVLKVVPDPRTEQQVFEAIAP